MRLEARRWALLCVACWIAACDEDADLEAPADTTGTVMWSGCSLLDDDRGCQLTRPTVRVWLEDQDAVWSWKFDEAPIEPAVEAGDGGLRFSFDSAIVSDGGVLSAWTSESASPAFELRIVPNPLDAQGFEFSDVVAAAMDAPLDERTRVAERLLSQPSTTPAEALVRTHYRRALLYDSGDPSGSAKAAIPVLEREVELAAEQGLWGARCDAVLALLFFGVRREDVALVERWRGLEPECRDRSAGHGADFDHYLATHALSMGAYAEAESRLDRYAMLAERVQPESEMQVVLDRMALYSRTGRTNEVRRTLQALGATAKDACEIAIRESWIGFARVRALQEGDNALGDPRPGLLRALRAHQGPCKSVAYETYDWIKLGYASALMHDVQGLEESVEQLSSRTLERKQSRQLAELRLELAVAQRRFDDVPALAATLEVLLRQGEPEARWRFQMVLAAAAQMQSDLVQAEQAYVAAEAVLDEIWADVASGTLRAHWLASYRRSALGLVRTRLALDDREGAACAARIARARALHPTGSSEGVCGRRWAREEDEVVFLIVPETDDAWRVFVIEGEQVRETASVRAPSGGDEPWWDAWDEELERAGQVRILASGQALREALHRERWRGRALSDARPVTFGLDLPALQSRPPSPTNDALVLFSDADPYRALGRYRPDVRRIYDVLGLRRWSVVWEDAVESASLSAALPEDGLFLYYGHGERVGLGGQEPLSERADLGSTALLLSGGTRWGVEDVSNLEHVPRSAVLLGCDVGFPDPETWTGGLNLAHALLLAGTTEVLAATGPIDAASATRVGVELLDTEPSSTFTLSRALHDVSAAASDAPADLSLDLFRVWSR